MGKRNDEYYSKLFDAIEIVHAENVMIMQGLIKLFNTDANSDKIQKACDDIQDCWEEKFRDIRKW